MSELKAEYREALRIDIEKYIGTNSPNVYGEDILKIVEIAYQDKTRLANAAHTSDSNCNIPLVSESKLWYVEFKQKNSTHVMSTTSDTSSRDAIERDLLLRDYEVVNIRRIYFR